MKKIRNNNQGTKFRMYILYALLSAMIALPVFDTPVFAYSINLEALFNTPYELLQKGSKGEDVRNLQQALIDKGYLSGNADGVYGNQTAEAVRLFSRINGLPESDIATPKMQKLLFEGQSDQGAGSEGSETEEPITVEMTGTDNSDLLSNCYIEIGHEYEYFIGPDQGLYECVLTDGKYYVNEATKICDEAGCLTTDGRSLYFLAGFADGTGSICFLEPGTGKYKSLYDIKEDLIWGSLQYARLSDQSEYLYYTQEINNIYGVIVYGLYRFDLNKGKTEMILDDNLLWYSLYEDKVYYSSFDEKGNIVLKTSGLLGDDVTVLNDTKDLISGFVEDDILFAYSLVDETVLMFTPDGKPKDGLSGFYDTSFEQNCNFVYEKGWVFYTSGSDGCLHRMRVNGTGDEPLPNEIKGAILVNAEDGSLWIYTSNDTGKAHETEAHLYYLHKDSGTFFEVGEPHTSWNLHKPLPDDFTYEENSDGSVTITGYKGKQTSFMLPDMIDGKTVSCIAENAFAESNIMEVGLPDTITRVMDNAFYHCEDLTFVGFSEGLASIGESAFGSCGNLASVDLPESLQSIGNLAFAEDALSEVTIPASVEKIGYAAFAMFASAGFEKIDVSDANRTYYSVQGVLFGKTDSSTDGAVLLQYPSGKQDTSYKVPEGTERIDSYAFAHAQSLEKVNIPSSVRQIGVHAFHNTAVKEITVSTDCDVPDNLSNDEIAVHRLDKQQEEKPAEEKQDEAQELLELAITYYNGNGVPQDYKKAFSYAEQSADQGNKNAQFLLGKMYQDGLGTDREAPEEAVKWYKLAAEQGLNSASYSLGECYETGTGVEEDIDEAVKWYTLAEEQGNKNAEEKLKELQN